MNNCGISRWDDPNEINARLKALTSQPIWEVTDEYYNNVILNYFDEKCKASKAVYEESKEYIPGGVQHNLAFNKPFPMCMARADGAYLYDKDGNQYIDFLQAGGPTILGSNYPVIREKVIELLNECGPVTGLLHESELMIAKEINRHMPNVEMFRMLGSGTESVMAALRIARIATGKKRIIKVGGAYHGWSDQMVYGLKIPGSRALLESHGIPGGCYEATDEVRPNDLTMLEDMLKRNVLLGGTAGVIVEPVGPESGTRPVAHDYNAGVPLGEFFTEHTENIVTEYDENNKPIHYALRKKREVSFDERTFKGRLNKVLSLLKNEFYEKRIVLLTPLHRAYAYFGGANVQPNELYANSIGEYFDAYVEAVRRAADIWAVELIDLYRESGLFPLDEKYAEKYFNRAVNDNLHPNAAGHKRIAQTILRNL